MSTVIRPNAPQPDVESIVAFLSWWFHGCTDGYIQICWSDKTSDYTITDAQNFGLHEIRAAAQRAAELNACECTNVYYRAVTVSQSARKSTSDAHFVQAPGVWIDADTSAQIQKSELAKTTSIVRPTITVVTGTQPSRREQSLFKSSVPLTDPKIVRTANKRLAAYFGTDKLVINPTRLLRLPGTINWPTPKKLLKEPTRCPELVTWHHATAEPSVVQAHLLPHAIPDTEALLSPEAPERKDSRLNVSDCVARIRKGEAWHDCVRDLVAHKVSKGEPDSEIHLIAEAVTWPGYEVSRTHEEIQVMIDGARKRRMGVADETLKDIVTDVKSVFAADPVITSDLPPAFSEDESMLVPISMGEMRRRYADKPVSLIDGVLFKATTTLIVGIPGAGKSPLAQHMIACTSLGLNWGGRPTKTSTTLIIAGESRHQTAVNIPDFAYNEVKKYYEIMGITAPDASAVYDSMDKRIFCLDVNFIIESDVPRLVAGVKSVFGDDPDVICFDTLRSVSSGSVNKDEDMALVQAAVANLRAAFPQAAIVIIHHSPKGDPEASSGSNRLEAMSDVIMAVVPIARASQTDDSDYVKRPDVYGPDTEGWSHYHARIVTIRNKVWQVARPIRMLVSVNSDKARVAIADAAEHELQNLRTVPAHPKVTVSPVTTDDSIGFAGGDGTAKQQDAELTEEMNYCVRDFFDHNSVNRFSLTDIVKWITSQPMTAHVSAAAQDMRSFRKRVERHVVTLVKDQKVLVDRMSKPILYWRAD